MGKFITRSQAPNHGMVLMRRVRGREEDNNINRKKWIGS